MRPVRTLGRGEAEAVIRRVDYDETDNEAGLISRRGLIKTGAAAAALAVASPAIIRGLASSGLLNFMGWAGYDFKQVFAGFTNKTGIKVNFVGNRTRTRWRPRPRPAALGAYDMSEPTADRTTDWVDKDSSSPWTRADRPRRRRPGVPQGGAGE